MSNTPYTATFDTRHEEPFTVVYHDHNGVLDTATPAVVSSDHPEIASVTLGTDGRSIMVAGESPGTAVISISFGDQPGQQNHLTVNVTAAPDLSSVSLTAGQIVAKP